MAEADLCIAWAARLQLPSWLSSTVIHVQTMRAQSGWQINLRSVRVQPEGSEIFVAAMNGDLERIQQLTKEGKASPWDVTPSGLGVFFVS